MSWCAQMQINIYEILVSVAEYPQAKGHHINIGTSKIFMLHHKKGFLYLVSQVSIDSLVISEQHSITLIACRQGNNKPTHSSIKLKKNLLDVIFRFSILLSFSTCA